MYDTQDPANRIWPSGVFFLEIPGLDLNPGDPKVAADWSPVTIEIGDPNLDPDDRNAVLDDVYGAERRGGWAVGWRAGTHAAANIDRRAAWRRSRYFCWVSLASRPGLRY